jgi:two-component system, chemotaxis family, CheB/CheR fusion protein
LTARQTNPSKTHRRKKSDTEHQPEEKHLPIIGIGASAGGLDALENFFAHVDPECGMAFVVIQHLDPTHKSIMSSLLKRFTKMEIAEIVDETKIEVNRIYLSPPECSIAIIDNILRHIAPEKKTWSPSPNRFFL